MKQVAENNELVFDYWTSDVQGNLGTKLKEIKESSTEYYVSAQEKYTEDGKLHWIGVSDVETRDDGKTYMKVAPTSVYDTDKASRTRDTWIKDEDGNMWIETSDVNKIYTYEKKKNK